MKKKRSKRKNLGESRKHFKAKRRMFIKLVREGYSLSYAASLCGFDWFKVRREIMEYPDIKEVMQLQYSRVNKGKLYAL